MTEAEQALEAIARAAKDLVPQLTERLARHGLGEIDVSFGDLHLRVVASTAAVPSAERAERSAAATTSPASAPAVAASLGVASPAVGFFVYAEGLGPGLAVEKGDSLGQVEMLGIRHDVRAPRRGTVRHLVAETGEAVEYGQVVLELEAQDVGR
jgi:biotin carboxyl carrier protein